MIIHGYVIEVLKGKYDLRFLQVSKAVALNTHPASRVTPQRDFPSASIDRVVPISRSSDTGLQVVVTQLNNAIPTPLPAQYIFPQNAESFDVWPIHCGPGISRKIIGRLLSNNRFTLMAIESNWGHLRLVNGTEGWSPMEYQGKPYLVPFLADLHSSLKPMRRTPGAPRGINPPPPPCICTYPTVWVLT